jgi:hypothetical protein
MSISQSIVKTRCIGLRWTGSLAYRAMKITYEKRVMVCPHCKHELEPLRYFGSKVFQYDSTKPDYASNLWVDLYENGELVWFSAPELAKFRLEW